MLPALGRLATIGFLSVLPCLSNAATSQVIGTYPVTVPAGNSAWVSGLVTAELYNGAAVTVTADVDGKALVTFSAPGWTGSEFTRHYAEPQSGAASGLAIDILSNTTDTLKLDTTPAAAGLTSGMTFIVRKHNTLAGLMPTGGGLTPFTDSVILFGTTGLQTSYFFNNQTQKWIDSLGADSSNVIVRPGQGFVIQAASSCDGDDRHGRCLLCEDHSDADQSQSQCAQPHRRAQSAGHDHDARRAGNREHVAGIQ